MTLEELQASPVWKLLTLRERDFVREYIAAGEDVYESVAKLFPGKTPTEVTAAARSLLGKKSVRAVLDFYHGFDKPTKEEFAQAVWDACKTNKGGAPAAALFKLYAELAGFTREPDERAKFNPEDFDA